MGTTNPETQTEGDMTRVNSCFFSVKSCLSNDDDDDDEDYKEDADRGRGTNADSTKDDTTADLMLLNDDITQLPPCATTTDGYSNSCCSRADAAVAVAAVTVTNKMTVDCLYHEIMMNIFSYMSAHDLASFSSTARRPNFDSFYFLQLQIEEAMHYGSTCTIHLDDERQWQPKSLAGAGAIARLAAMNQQRAEEIVKLYRDSNLPHGMSLSARAQLAAATAQRNKGTAMMLTALGAASVMGSEPAQALLSMGMCAQLVRSSIQNVNVKEVQHRMIEYLHFPHLPLPDSGFESIFPTVVATRLNNFAANHGLVVSQDNSSNEDATGGSSSEIEADSEKVRGNSDGVFGTSSGIIQDEKKETEANDVNTCQYPYSHELLEHGLSDKGNKTHRTAPSGCVGAYTKAVRSASKAVREIVKQKRQDRFLSLSIDFRQHLCSVFIDACSSDANYDMVVNLVKDQGVDPDGFYSHADGTESCAIHVASANGAVKVLEFLCTGVDEKNADEDGGLCDVDILDDNGWSAVHFAAGVNGVAAIKILATYGAQLTVEAHNGYTPFRWAQRLAKHEAAEELKKLHADERFYELKKMMFGAGQPMQHFAQNFFGFRPQPHD